MWRKNDAMLSSSDEGLRSTVVVRRTGVSRRMCTPRALAAAAAVGQVERLRRVLCRGTCNEYHIYIYIYIFMYMVSRGYLWRTWQRACVVNYYILIYNTHIYKITGDSSCEREVPEIAVWRNWCTFFPYRFRVDLNMYIHICIYIYRTAYRRIEYRAGI